MATLKDVAKAAGLSVGTVSRVLNNRGYISEETRQSVYQAMKKLDYRPNEMARSLSKKMSNMIGVIVPNIEHPYFSKYLAYLENSAHREGYELLLFASGGKAAVEDEYVTSCVSNRVAGVILCSGQIKTARLRNLGFPVITYERFIKNADAGVECDNFEGGILAAEELIRAGSKKLMCITEIGKVAMPGDARSKGFAAACRQHDVEDVKVSAISTVPDGDMRHMDEIRSFIDEMPDVDGVFATSDVLAVQAMNAIRERGRKIPSDVKVIGYDDVLISELAEPGLTTIHQPVKEMAEACVDIIKKASQGENVPARTTFHVSLVRRGTT